MAAHVDNELDVKGGGHEEIPGSRIGMLRADAGVGARRMRWKRQCLVGGIGQRSQRQRKRKFGFAR